MAADGAGGLVPEDRHGHGVGDMTVEPRAVPDSPPAIERSAVDALREIGPWEGETYAEVVALVAG